MPMPDQPERALPLLLIVLGPPASGKTTLARRLAADLPLPMLGKDMIKEALGDVLGCEDVAQSRRLGHASIVLLHQFAEVHMAARCSCIVECNYRAEWNNAPFQELLQRYPYRALQVLCRADPDVLTARYRQRTGSGQRHPVHKDNARLAGLDADLVRAHCRPLDIGGTVIDVNTTDFAAVDYPALLDQIRAIVAGRAG
jgi:predicted kinase